MPNETPEKPALKTPQSGPHSIEDLIAQIADYKKQPNTEWTVKSVHENARELYNALERLAKANDIVWAGNAASTLGHPFNKHKPVCKEKREDLITLVTAHKKKNGLWTEKAVRENAHKLYNTIVRWGYGNGKLRIHKAAEALGHPFKPQGFQDASEDIVTKITDYKKNPNAEWTVKSVRENAHKLYQVLDRWASANDLTWAGNAANALGHPFNKHKLVCKEKREDLITLVTAHKKKNGLWTEKAVRENAHKLYNTIVRWGYGNGKLRIHKAAEALGHPFELPKRGGKETRKGLLAQIRAYKEKPKVVWTNGAVRENAHKLYQALDRWAHAHNLSWAGKAVDELGHPFERAIQRHAIKTIPKPSKPAIPKTREELIAAIATYKETHGDDAWTVTDLPNKSKKLYNSLERYCEAKDLTSRSSAAQELGQSFNRKKRVLTKVPRRKNPPFDIAAFTAEAKTLRETYRQEKKPWRYVAILQDNLYLWNKLARLGNYWFMPKHKKKRIGMAAKKLGLPFETQTNEIKRTIDTIIELPESQYQLRPIVELKTGSPLERRLYNQLIGRLRRNSKVASHAAMRKIVVGMGYRVPDFEAVERAAQKHNKTQAEPKWEEQDDKLFEEEFNKIWLFEKLKGIHPMKPSHIKKNEGEVWYWARKLFGSTENALEAWQPDAYKESLGKYTKQTHTIEDLETAARDALIPLFAEKMFVSREEMRILHPKEYHPVETLRKRLETGYNGVLARLGFKSELTSDEKKAIGRCGELFSLAYHLLRADEEKIEELHPHDPTASKIEIDAPDSPNKLIIPDISWGNGSELNLTEAKAGGTFQKAAADHILEKYSGELRIKDGEGIPVYFKEVHLHMPREHLEAGVQEKLKGAARVLVAQDIAQAFAQYQVPAAIQNLYQRFAVTPVRFIHDSTSGLGNLSDFVSSDRKSYTPLEKLIAGLAPERFRPRKEQDY